MNKFYPLRIYSSSKVSVHRNSRYYLVKNSYLTYFNNSSIIPSTTDFPNDYKNIKTINNVANSTLKKVS
jgi:hypothetical protein